MTGVDITLVPKVYWLKNFVYFSFILIGWFQSSSGQKCQSYEEVVFTFIGNAHQFIVFCLIPGDMK